MTTTKNQMKLIVTITVPDDYVEAHTDRQMAQVPKWVAQVLANDLAHKQYVGDVMIAVNGDEPAPVYKVAGYVWWDGQPVE